METLGIITASLMICATIRSTKVDTEEANKRIAGRLGTLTALGVCILFVWGIVNLLFGSGAHP